MASALTAIVPVHLPPPLSAQDRDVLRSLAEAYASAAQSPLRAERRALWQRTNDLSPIRPPVLIYQIPWHEMDVDGSLALRCTHPWAREVELSWRRALYQWRHMPGDMLLDDCLYTPISIEDSGLGIAQHGRTLDQLPGSVHAQQFEPQLQTERDIEKIRMPRISINEEETEAHVNFFQEAVGDILPVRTRGITRIWFAPWDEIIRWYGVEQALMDLIARPDFVEAVVARTVDAYLHRLRQYEDLGLLEFNNGNERTGSGGLALTKDLPGADTSPAPASTMDCWGCAAAQIFSEVSPEMHLEFALRHELRWLERFGLNYYGCCEPLHRKIEILRQIPRLRKVSVSPWADVAEAVAQGVGTDYVLSLKPSPAILAERTWDCGRAEQQLREKLDACRGLAVEVILKDISTVAGEPQRLWEWWEMAARLVTK